MNRAASLLTILCATGYLLAGLAAAAEIEDTSSHTLPISNEGIFILDNINGSIEIDTWDDNRLVLDCRKVVRAETQAKAREWLEQVEIDIQQVSPSRVEVETVLPESSSGFFSFLFSDSPKGHVDYRVRLPYRVCIDVESVNGSIRIQDPGGSVLAETVNGSVRVTGASCPVQACTVNGSVHTELIDLKPVSGSQDWLVKLSSVNGQLTLHLPAAVTANVEASTLNGSITDDFDLPVDSGFVGKSIETAIGGGGKLIMLETINGSIRILKND